MNTKLNRLISLLNENIRLFISISLGVFFFILFFQPFQLDIFDFNNRLLFVAGFGIIIFLILLMVRIFYPMLIKNKEADDDEDVFPSYLYYFIVCSLSSVAFVFYLQYVGSIQISFYITFKVVLICITPPVILQLNKLNRELKIQNASLIKEKKLLQMELKNYEDDTLNKSIEFISENTSENFKITIAEIAFIKSADNYVEIVYMHEESFKKKLIRNTLKNIELQIKQYTNFIRCHRICIVNTHYIEKFNKGYGNHWISIKGYSEPLPVSRQYLLKIKEAI